MDITCEQPFVYSSRTVNGPIWLSPFWNSVEIECVQIRLIALSCARQWRSRARAQRNQNQFKCVYCWFRLRFKAMKKRNSRKCHCLDDGAAEIVLESRHWNTNNHYYVYKVRYYLFFHATHSTLLPRPSIESSHGHRTLILRIYNIFFFFIHTTHVPPTMQRNKETAEETKRNERKKKPIRIYWIK